MPTYQTLEPISVTLELGVGHVRISASDRADTSVEVRPSDATDQSDVKAAQQVRIDHTEGVLRVTGPRVRAFDFSRRTRSVDVLIDLPVGSDLSVELQVGDIRCAGRLGQCRLKTSAGNVWAERTGPLRLDTSVGHITVDGVNGNAEISTGSGKIRVGGVEGTAVIKNSNGDTVIEKITGDLRVRSANGDIQVDRAGAGADVKTSNGGIRLGEVSHGSIVLGTAMGDLDIGIAEGAVAWLDVHTGFGQVRNLLSDATRPDDADRVVEIHGRTSYGDITVHRS